MRYNIRDIEPIYYEMDIDKFIKDLVNIPREYIQDNDIDKTEITNNRTGFNRLLLEVKKHIPPLSTEQLDLLNRLFYEVYIPLCLEYGNIPTLGMYCYMIGIDLNTISKWGGTYNNKYGNSNRALNPAYMTSYRKWLKTIETIKSDALVNSDGKPMVNLMFDLKVNHGWIEQEHKPQEIEQKPIMTIEEIQAKIDEMTQK